MEMMKVTRFIWNFRKETEWLREMAESGWFLKDMKFGVKYIFEKGEPKNMVYEVDRFNLPAHPTEDQITQKEDFIAMAEELGWKVVLHDEDLNYYFAKEYEEDGMNELYDTDEARRVHAEKYTSHFNESVKLMSICTGIMFAALTLILGMQMIEGFEDKFFNVFMLVFMILGTIFVFSNVLLLWAAKINYNTFILSREEWEEQYLKHSCERKERKLFLRTRSLINHLEKMSKEGWHVQSVRTRTQVYEPGVNAAYRYAIDTKKLTNRRRVADGEERIIDKRDWNGINNDWQIESLKDAKEKGWSYVCAMDNRVVLYRSAAEDNCSPINPPEREGKFLAGALLGAIGKCMLVGFVLGLILGVVMSIL